MGIDLFYSLLSVKLGTCLPPVDPKIIQKRIESKPDKKLNVKFGIDPTGSNIHIGHLCPIFVLNLFQKCGHNIDFVIGDFTARIGDPSGQSSERSVITGEQIEANYATYAKQVSPYIDIKKMRVRKNSEWLCKTSLMDFIGLQQNIKISVSMQREDFRHRMKSGSITNAELLYASLMGLDSIALDTDVEIGGVDQLLNLQQCRLVQEVYGRENEIAVTVPILEGTDGTGRKMSKSYGNYIPVNATADEKFGKFMSIPDSLILPYYKAFAYIRYEELGTFQKFIKANPLEAKKQIAQYFISIEAKSIEAGEKARERFEKKFTKKELVDGDFKILEVVDGLPLLDALFTSGDFKSKNELRRLQEQKAIKSLGDGKYKVGKLGFYKIKPF
ncbi:MAG: tyrosine--tRNA ligase [Christensenellaceae bacterium]|nr:tyrosine--tRNA ligase [Christensenellaceae bacterium]